MTQAVDIKTIAVCILLTLIGATATIQADEMQVKGPDAANLVLKVEADDPATSPALGAVQWYGKNDQGETVLYIMMNSEIQDPFDETGVLQLQAGDSGGLNTVLEISMDGVRVVSGDLALGALDAATSLTLPGSRGNLGQFLKQGDDGQLIWGDVESINRLSDVEDVTTAGLANGYGLKWNDTQWEPVSLSESDPVYSGSAASGISSGDIGNWNTAYGWGDHSGEGYLTSESDPTYTGSPASGISSGDISNWNTAYGWGNHASAGYLTSESDPSYTGSPASGISSGDISNWNTAYGWGDHAGEGYLKTEADTLSSVTGRGAVASTQVTFNGGVNVNNTGLRLKDTDASHSMIIKPGSNLSADRTLTVTTGNANRTLTLNSNVALNQNLQTTNSPSFAGLTVDTSTFKVDSTNNRVGMGTASPEAPVHIYNGNVSITPHSYSDLVIEDDYEAYISILTDRTCGTKSSGIYFGDQTGNALGQISYNNYYDQLTFVSAGSHYFRLNKYGAWEFQQISAQDKSDTNNGLSQLFAHAGEVYAQDTTYNQTPISPHAFKLFEPEMNDDPAIPWDYYSRNPLIGKEMNVDMLKMARLVEQLSGEQLVYVRDLPAGEIKDSALEQQRISDSLIQEKKEEILKSNPWFEVTPREAYEATAEYEDVETTTTVTRYRMNLTTLTPESYQAAVATTVKQPTGRTIKALKENCRFDPATGKCYRRRTPDDVTLEAATLQEIADRVELPQYVLDRLPQKAVPAK